MKGRARFLVRLGVGLAVLSAVAVFSFGLERVRLWLAADGRFPVGEIRVEGNRLLFEGEVVELAGALRGTNLFALDPAAVEERLVSSPWIAYARVSRRPPDRVIVRIEERRPWLLDLEGEAEFVDREGNRVPTRGKEIGLDLPLLVDPSRRAADVVPRLAAAFPEENDWIAGSAAEVRIDEDGSVTLVASAEKTRVRLGRDSFDTRAERLLLVLRTWEATGERYREIDLRFGDQAVARGKIEAKGEGRS